MAATLSISILADARKARQVLSDTGGDLVRFGDAAETSSSRFGTAMAGIGKAVVVAGAAVAAGVGVLGVGAIKKASELEQSIGGVDAVFKQSAGTVHDWAQSAATDLGLTRNEFNELATVTGAQLKNMGVPMGDVAGKTHDLTKLAADLAAQFGGSTKDAMQAIGSLMRGEADPIERYGVGIKKTDVNARLAAKGMGQLTGEALKQAETQELLAMLFEQTADAQGAFARESRTLAGAQQRLRAIWVDLQTDIGTLLLPVLADLGSWLVDRLPGAIARLTPVMDNAFTWISDVAVPAARELVGWVGERLGAAFELAGRVIGRTPIGAALQGVLGFLQTEPGEKLRAFLADRLAPVFETVERIIRETVLPRLGEFRDFVTGEILPRLVNVVVDRFTEVARIVRDDVLPKLDELRQRVADVDFVKGGEDARGLGDSLSTLYNDTLKPMGDYLGGLYTDHIKSVVGFFVAWGTVIATVLTPVATWLFEHVFRPLMDYIRENGEVFEMLGRVLRVVATIISVVLLVPLALLTVAFFAVVAAVAAVILVLGTIMATCWKVVQVFWDLFQNTKNAVSDAFWWVKDRFDAVVSFMQGIPGRIGDAVSGMWNGVKSGLAGVLNAVASMWNSTIGGLGFTTPDWVPILGGKRWDFPDMGYVQLAGGGLVTGPTYSLIGEAGPELVIPLSQLGRMGNVIYNVTVVSTGLGADSPQIQRDVVAALRGYERRNGKL
jgi:hypothetical protein